MQLAFNMANRNIGAIIALLAMLMLLSASNISAMAQQTETEQQAETAQQTDTQNVNEVFETSENAGETALTLVRRNGIVYAGKLPPAPANPENILLLDLSTGGRVAIELYPQIAPRHVERIKTLTQQGFYNGLKFHRVIEGFMAQTGDPDGTGAGGSDLADLNAEFNNLPYVRGSLAMARTNDPNSANSQFFISFGRNASLDMRYTNFGRVASGMEYIDAIERGEPPANPTRILQASLKSQNLPEPDYASAQNRADALQQPPVSLDELNAPIP